MLRADDRKPCIALHPYSLSDPDGSRTVRVLTAYFELAEARTRRRLLYQKLMFVTLVVACVLEVATPLLPVVGLVASLGMVALVGGAAGIAEWRAQRRLAALASQTTHA